ncbi:MAG: S49 family peptidase, partial [Pseudomonadota bacterium]
PFRPEQEKDVAILRAVQDDIHAAFVDIVKSRRGERLADDPDIFSGRFWSGTSALGLGLIDGIGSPRQILHERYGKKARIRPISSARPSLLRGRLGVGAPFAGAEGLSAEALIGAVRSDRLFDRYGL